MKIIGFILFTFLVLINPIFATDNVWIPYPISLDTNDRHPLHNSLILTLPDLEFLNDVGVPKSHVITPFGNETGYATALDVGFSIGGTLRAGDKRIIYLGEPVKRIDGKIPLIDENNSAGYLLIEVNSFELNFGVSGSTLSGLRFVGIGTTGSFGRGALVKRFIATKEELDKKYKPKIPSTIEQLKEYHLGDSITFSTTGALLFDANLGAGISLLTAGVILQGEWKKTVKKTGEYEVEVETEKIKVLGARLKTGAIIVKAQVAQIISSLNSIKYRFNLKSKNGLNLYYRFMHGDFLSVQQFLKDNPNGDVKLVTKTVGVAHKRDLYADIGVPFLFWYNYDRERTRSFSITTNYDDDILIDNHIGVFRKTIEKGGILSNFKKINAKSERPRGNVDKEILFLGMLKNIYSISRENKNPQNPLIGATLKYRIDGSKFNQKLLKRSVDEMIQWTGYPDEIKFNIQKDILGYIRMDFDLQISNVSIEKLMNEAFKISEKDWVNLAMVSLRNYLENTDDEFNYCDTKSETINKSCKVVLEEKTKYAMTLAHRGLKNMKQALDKKDFNEFALNFSKFGEGLTQNHFTLKTIWWVMRGTPVRGYFRASGQDINPYVKQIL